MGWYSQHRRKRHLRQGLTRPSWRSAMSGRHPVLSQRDMLVKFGDIWGWYRCRWHWDIIIMGYIQPPLLAMICPFVVLSKGYHTMLGGVVVDGFWIIIGPAILDQKWKRKKRPKRSLNIPPFQKRDMLVNSYHFWSIFFSTLDMQKLYFGRVVFKFLGSKMYSSS